MAEALPGEGAGRAAHDAWLAAACLAIAPAELGGILVRTDSGEGCQLWLEGLRALLEPEIPLRRMPAHIDDDGLLGGIDLGATLRAGRAVRTRGLLAEANRAVILLSGAERLPARSAALVAAALEGAPQRGQSGFGLVALDGGVDAEEQCPRTLAERLALHIDLREVPGRALQAAPFRHAAIARARKRYGSVRAEADAVRALCAAAAACGIESMHAPLLALKVACACAALGGRAAPAAEDLGNAARLVLAARARVDPAQPADAPAQPEDGPPEDTQPERRDRQQQRDATAEERELPSGELAEQVLAAARAAIPAQLLASLNAGDLTVRRAAAAGKAGATVLRGRRGRPAGVHAGRPRDGARLNIVATLRAAAPWQRLRRAADTASTRAFGRGARRVSVRAEDFRITRYRQRSETATLFVLDASGSSAMHRLAEVKGAIELLLAECYVRRDQVAVVAFRGRKAELVLAPTRSLVRAKRSLAGLPGGGGTPLAAGLDAGRELAEQLRRRGLAPALVVLTDGQANVARDGSGGRQRAGEEALRAARAWRACGLQALLIDTAPRPQLQARALADAMRARYVPLPHADARALLGAVRGR